LVVIRGINPENTGRSGHRDPTSKAGASPPRDKSSPASSAGDPCVFYGTVDGYELYLLLYVDDGLILSKSSEAIHKLLNHTKRSFEMTIGRCQCYVGTEIRRDRCKKKIYIGQQAYIKKL
ncbi:hypothetical protein CBL_21308, partial [Carabus blaptoides fortunei]